MIIIDRIMCSKDSSNSSGNAIRGYRVRSPWSFPDNETIGSAREEWNRKTRGARNSSREHVTHCFFRGAKLVDVARHRCIRKIVIITETEVQDEGAADAGTGSGFYKVAVTSMHICARIFAWVWDLLVGSAAYPMQQVSMLACLYPDIPLWWEEEGRDRIGNVWTYVRCLRLQDSWNWIHCQYLRIVFIRLLLTREFSFFSFFMLSWNNVT